MNNPSPKSGLALLFDWQPPEGEKVAIAAFLGLSALLHALGFYLFQIVYPPAVALLAPRARVSVIAPNSEEGRTILRWVDAEDPALVSATLRPAEAESYPLPTLHHVPSYLLEQPRLKQPPPLKREARAPSAIPPGPVPMPRPAIAPAAAPASTRLLLSGELAKLGPLSSPSSGFVASTGESPEAVRFRIAVGAKGDIRYCFRLNSSGDPALDEQARRYLVLSRFPQRPSATRDNDRSLVWGIATMQWGNDVAPPPSTSTASPP